MWMEPAVWSDPQPLRTVIPVLCSPLYKQRLMAEAIQTREKVKTIRYECTRLLMNNSITEYPLLFFVFESLANLKTCMYKRASRATSASLFSAEKCEPLIMPEAKHFVSYQSAQSEEG